MLAEIDCVQSEWVPEAAVVAANEAGWMKPCMSREGQTAVAEDEMHTFRFPDVEARFNQLSTNLLRTAT